MKIYEILNNNRFLPPNKRATGVFFTTLEEAERFIKSNEYAPYCISGVALPSDGHLSLYRRATKHLVYSSLEDYKTSNLPNHDGTTREIDGRHYKLKLITTGL